MSSRPNARGQAAELLHRVAYGGRSLDRVLAEASLPARDGPLIHELAIGSVRHFFSLSDEIGTRLNSPLKPRDAIVLCLLLVGAYQIRHTRIPRYAAVNETVNAAQQIGRPWARGVINHVLRRIASEPPPEPSTEEAEYDHPAWMIDLIRADYPSAWRQILTTSLTRAPLSLRVNLAVTERLTFQALLTQRGVIAHLALPEEGLVLDAPTPVAELPGFSTGRFTVQDSGAMWAAPLLAATGTDRVLDACAAPGGKALHLLQRAPRIRLTALEIDTARCDLLRSEFRRTGLDPAPILQGDATALEWWDEKPYQRVLLDAPCSGTGTLRRHPDIKLLKHEADLAPYQELQGRLLENLWRVLASGGRLLYCTCSLLSLENDRVIDNFVSQARDARHVPIIADWGIATQWGRQLLPAINGSDGFYYAILQKG